MGYPNKQNNPAAAIPVYIAPAPAGSGLTPTAENIVANGNNLLKTGAGIYYGLSVNTIGTGSTAKIYDGVDNTGTLLATIDTTKPGANNAVAGGYPLAVGLFVVTAGGVAADITVSYG